MRALLLQYLRHVQELSISGVSCEDRYGVSTVLRRHAGLIVHDEIHAYGLSTSLAEATEYEVFNAKEPGCARRVGATSTRPQVDVMPHLDEPHKNVASVRTRASAGDESALDVEEDIHMEASGFSSLTLISVAGHVSAS